MITPPLKNYIDQLKDKRLKILIPGVGFGYEAVYLWNNGFKNLYVVDVAPTPLAHLKNRLDNFPNDQILLLNLQKIRH